MGEEQGENGRARRENKCETNQHKPPRANTRGRWVMLCIYIYNFKSQMAQQQFECVAHCIVFL